MAEERRVAWIDESGSNPSRDPGTYIMAAALVQRSDEGALRDQMRTLRLKRQAKLHWRDESLSRQRVIATALRECGVEHLVAVSAGHAPSVGLERRRRLTMEILLPALALAGVHQANLESRGAADDARDVRMRQHLRQQLRLPETFRIDHIIGRAEPLLWIPDAVCGIVSLHRCGNSEFAELLHDTLTVFLNTR